MPGPKGRNPTPPASFQDLDRRVRTLEDNQTELAKRLARVEQLMPELANHPLPAAEVIVTQPAEADPVTTLPATNVQEQAAEPIFFEPVTSPATPLRVPAAVPAANAVQTPIPAAVPARPANRQPTDPVPQNERNLETWIGTYWLNRLGIASLVIGFAFLLMHSYQYFGPALKIGAGIAAGAALIVGGEWLVRRDRQTWFGRGLVGGGYAIAYFTLYAMQNIASVKLIDNPLLDAVLLLGLASTCMLHAMRSRTEVIALLSTLLGFLTISLSPIGTFSAVALAVLVGGLAYVVHKMRWLNVLVAGSIGSYLCFALFTQPQIGHVSDWQFFATSEAFLALFWLFLGGIPTSLARTATAESKKVLLGLSIFNAVAFVGLSLLSMQGTLEPWRYAFMLASGAVYFTLAWTARDWREYSVSATLAGLSLVSAAVPMKLDAQAVTAVWLLELPLLVYAGTRLRLEAFRWFSLPFALLLALNVLSQDIWDGSQVAGISFYCSWRLLIGIPATFAYGLSGYLFRRDLVSQTNTQANNQIPSLNLLAASLMTIVALVFVAALTGQEISHSYRPLAFALEWLGLIALAGRLRAPLLNFPAVGFFALATASLATFATLPQIALVVLPLLLMYLGAFAYRQSLIWVPGREYELDIFHAYTAATTVLACYLCGQHLPIMQSGVAFISICVTVIVAGFALKDGALRQLPVLGIIVGFWQIIWLPALWSWSVVVPVVAVLYGVALLYSLWATSNRGLEGGGLSNVIWNLTDESVRAKNAYAPAATLLLSLAVMQLMHWQLVALVWAVQGLFLMAAGFAFKEKVFRVLGLMVFAALGGKLLFYDLSGADTTWRIVSFIGAGVVLLLSSYGYSWFVRQLEAAEQQERRS